MASILLVQVKPVPPAFWLAPAMDVLLLFACCNSTSGISSKAACSRPSVIADRLWVGGCFWVVEGCERASFPGRERHWLILLGGIVIVVFRLKHCERQMLGVKSESLYPKHKNKKCEGANIGIRRLWNA
jgi:hypothetical protein